MPAVQHRDERASMPERNLFRLDDTLIKGAAILGGLVLLVLAAVASAVATGEARMGGGAWLATGMAVLAPVGLLAAGLALRRRERRALAVLRVLERQVVVAADDLLHSFQLTRVSLAQAIRDVNDAGLAFLVWDTNTDQVQDGRLRKSVLQFEKCGSCGAGISQEVPLHDFSQAGDCPHCGCAISPEDIAEARESLLREVQQQNRRDQPTCEKPDFSIATFTLLALLCWPLAIIYVARRWKMGQ